MPEKLIYTWEDYTCDVENIVGVLNGLGITHPHFVSIYRGSLGLGSHLSNIFDAPLSIIKFQTRDGDDKEPKWIVKEEIKSNQTIIVLDDILDTGKTLSEIKEFINHKIHGITLHRNNFNTSLDWVTSLNLSHGMWVEYPWEVTGQ